MVRLSTLATSTFTSALKVLSTVLPDSTFFSLERTTAPPLPGLWCWNQMTCQSWPSRLSTMPFFRSFVVAMRVVQPSGRVFGRVVKGRSGGRGPADESSQWDPISLTWRLAPRVPLGLTVAGDGGPGSSACSRARPEAVRDPRRARLLPHDARGALPRGRDSHEPADGDAHV